VLKNLFLEADKDNRGFLTKDALLQAIRQDLTEDDDQDTQINKKLDLRIESCNSSKEEVFSSGTASSPADPVVKMMEDLLSKEMSAKSKCQNLVQSLEYISTNRISSLAQNVDSISSLISTVRKYITAL